MSLPLPWPDVRRQTPQGQSLDGDAVQQNLEKISMEWPQASSNWTSYTATVSSTSVTLGTGGTNVARYQKNGKTVHANGMITLGTSGVFTGTDITIALPFAAAAYPQVGVALANNVGSQAYVGACFVESSGSTFKCKFEGNTYLGATTPFTWGDTDWLRWQITYEAAA